MTYKHYGLILLLNFLLVANATLSCTLAYHDWDLIFYNKITLNSPVIPFAELNLLMSKADEDISDVIWISSHSMINYLQSAFFPVINNILSSQAHSSLTCGTCDDCDSAPTTTTWHPAPSDISVGAIAHNYRLKENTPLIVGSDNITLKIALFADANSNYRCYQLILFQENRIRAIRPSSTNPWATQLNASSFFSLIFFDIPFPGRILAASFYPDNNIRRYLITNEDMVMYLIHLGLLQERPPEAFSPDFDELPELPE